MGGTGLWPKSVTPRLVLAAQDGKLYYHGTPDERTWETGASYGIHVGTEEAAREALHARIGRPAEGEWDGTREYGKTLLDQDLHSHSLNRETGEWEKKVNRRPPAYPTGNAAYSDGGKVPTDARPSVFPVRIKGPMTNSPERPHGDWHANGYMRRQISQGNARRGYYYINVSEDEGSVSAVVPSAGHLERVHPSREAAREETVVPRFGRSNINFDYFDDEDANEHSIVASIHSGPSRRYVGTMRWSKDTGIVSGLGVEPKYQRRGVATHMWNMAHGYSPSPRHSDNMTSDARAWSRNLPPREAAAAEGPWYHGTNADLREGDAVDPRVPEAGGTNRAYVYMSHDPGRAYTYASFKAFNHGGEARVYEVQPAGKVVRDPHGPGNSYRSERGLTVVRQVINPPKTPWEELSKEGAWKPSSGIFAPTTGLDPQLFEDGSLRPQVRGAIMERLDRCLRVDSGLAGSDWQQWLRVWIAGGSASEWAGGRPNDQAQDLDVIVGLDLAQAQGNSSFEGMDQAQAATALNAAFRHCFNDQDWHPEFGGTWSLTAYCNPHISSDITVIRPYAAWDLTDGRWAVRPPHLPGHTLADFDPATAAHARAVLAEARSVLRMPEPLRTREARSLWQHVHEHRCEAFSAEGTGWDDPGNVDEKMLAYAPRGVLERIRDLAMARTAAAEETGPYYHGTRYNLSPGDVLEGGAKPANNPGAGRYEHVYMARTPSAAHAAGSLAYDEHGYQRGAPSVYEVEPLDQPERDPFTDGAVRSKRARVLRRVDPANPPCSHCGDPLSDDDMEFGASEHLGCEGQHTAALTAAREEADPDDDPVTEPTEGEARAVLLLPEPFRQQEARRILAEGPQLPADLEERLRQAAAAPGGRTALGHGATAALAEGEPLPNPYHGDARFPGRRPRWSDRWFHGTKLADPDMARGLPEKAPDASGERWPMPNTFLGTHFSPLHRVAHQFAISHRGPSALVHARLNFRNPRRFADERELNIDMARWAHGNFPGWHNDEANEAVRRDWDDEEGTHRRWGSGDRDEESERADYIMRWHPHTPEIARAYVGHLHAQGHHGIVYGNELEGPGAPNGHVLHMSAIATHPDQIETSRVEHIAQLGQEPEPHQVAWKGDGSSETLNEPDEMWHSIGVHHQGGDYWPVKSGQVKMPFTAAREEAAPNPPCCYCGEPLEDEDVRDSQSAHEECSDMRWCQACDEHHDDPQETDNHNETYTDWGNHLPFEHGVHRGTTIRLPSAVHAVVHDEARPRAERAGTLAAHLRENPIDHSDERGHAGGYGLHWTDHEPTARAWGTGEGAMFGPSEEERSGRSWTHVVMHAASPDEDHIETDPRVLSERNLLGYDHARSEREIPLRAEAPVRLTGLSWKRADQPGWNRHNFAEPGSRLAAVNPDRYVACEQGHQHWGALGAAGLLIRHRGDDGQYRYLLQHRSPGVQHGGTWSTPGGALQHGETPERGARREAEEEFGELPSGLVHHHTFEDDHGNWKYSTVVLDSPHRFSPGRGDEDSDWESQGHRWCTPQEVKSLSLHPGFASSWDKVRKSGAVRKTAGYVPGTPLYHGSLRQFAPGTVLTPEARDPDGSSFSGDYVYATESPESARYFGSMRDCSPLSDADVHVHRVEPVGDVEPDEFPQGAEREEYSHGNYRAKALRVVDHHVVPGHWSAKTAAAQPVPAFANNVADGDGPFEPGAHPGPFLHGSVNRIEPGSLVRQDAMPEDHGRAAHSYFTTDRQVAEDAADMRNGRGHGWIHQVEPTGRYEVDHGEPDSFRSAHPLRVVSVEPGRLNGSAPHEPILREAARGLQPWMEWAASGKPHQAVIWHAQQRTREEHPELTQRLPEPDGEGFSKPGEEILHRALVAGGYPPGHAARTFVMMHGEPERGVSQVALIGNRIGVALHPGSWHAGTIAHEAAHLLDIRRRGVDPRVPQADRDKHGPEFAGHYADTLNEVSPGAGDDFLNHYADAATLVGNYRFRAHGLPRDFSDEIRREGSGPRPDYDPSEELPEGRGIWYRAHDRRHPLDEAHARSAPLNHGYRPFQTDPAFSAGQRGYSSFASPHELSSYMDEMEWKDTDSWKHRDAVAFHGKHVGVGEDNEPLVVPEANPHCCGRVIHTRMPWDEFEGKLWHGDYADEESHKYHNPQELWRENNEDHELSERRLKHINWRAPEVKSERRHREKEERRQQREAAAELDGTTIRMVPPEEYRKYAYPDYPVKSLPALARHLRKLNPAYYDTLRGKIEESGVQEPVLARFSQNGSGRPLKQPQMMNGHHRAAIAHELGLHLPIGDYDNHADYEAAHQVGMEWFREYSELKAAGKSGWRTEAAVSREAAVSDGPWYHGSEHPFRPGDLVNPGYPSPHRGGSDDHVYFTSDPGEAAVFARPRRGGHVYEVEPQGSYEGDPEDEDRGINYQSMHPLRIVRRVPPPWQRKEAVSGYEAVPGYDGVEFSHHHQDLGDQEVHMMAATHPGALPSDDPWGGGTGISHHIGHISWTDWHDGEEPEVDNLVVANRFRHQGIATELWRRAREVEPRLRHSGEMTDAGRSWARTVTGVSGYKDLTERSGMIYLDLPDDAVRHLPGGVDDHHITLVYLGKDVSDEAFAEACRRAKKAAGEHPPMKGSIGGLGSFPPSDSSDGKKPVFVPVDVPGIHKLRKSLEDLSESEHGFHPHVTLAYLEDGEAMPKPHPTVPVSFGRLHVKRGDEITSFPFGGQLSKAAAWDRSGSENHGVYLRFGHWPDDERSYSPAGGYKEEGVSAYDLDRNGDPSIDHGLDRTSPWHHEHDEHCEPDCDLADYDDQDAPDNDPREEMQGRVKRAERHRYYGEDEPGDTGHLVRGDMSGVGYDGEPLLKNVRRVGDWIDHRHLFLDQAHPHRLARDPAAEDYEEPEEKAPYSYRDHG
jgi:8-oxo-dGTP diphosphatase